MRPVLVRSGLLGHLLARSALPRESERLVCAVSGGPDSLALLALACAAGHDVVAVHVDHGLRSESGAEAEVVARAAERLGVRLERRRVHVSPGPNLEARARQARLKALPPSAATGHTMDDQAETVLIHLLRGTGIDGLAAMRLGPRHPLLRIRRSETRALVEELGLEAIEDPSNTDPRFVRNRIRHELLPLACEIAGRDVVPLLARLAELAAEERALLDELAEGLDPTDVRALRAAPAVLARRALRRWLACGGYPPGRDATERVLEVALGTRRATELEGGMRVQRRHGRLVRSLAGGSEARR
jgi:tRNA(Ile)-lysidine synthase